MSWVTNSAVLRSSSQISHHTGGLGECRINLPYAAGSIDSCRKEHPEADEENGQRIADLEEHQRQRHPCGDWNVADRLYGWVEHACDDAREADQEPRESPERDTPGEAGEHPPNAGSRMIEPGSGVAGGRLR